LEIFLFLIYLSGFIVLLKYYKRFHISFLNGWALPIVFALKASLALYLYYFPISYLFDVPIFLDETKQLAAVLYKSPSDFFSLLTGIGETKSMVLEHLRETIHWDQQPGNVYNDSKNLVRFNTLLYLFSFGYFPINLLWISFISLLGLFVFYKTITHFTTDSKGVLFNLLFILPTSLLWGSSILKEPYLLLAFGLFLNGIFVKRVFKKRLIILLTGVILLLSIKPYILLCLIPALFAIWIYKQLNRYKIILTSTTILFVTVLTWGLTFLSNRNLTEVISLKQFNFINMAEGGIWIKTDTNFIALPKTEESKFLFKMEHQNRIGQLQEPTVGWVKKNGLKQEIRVELIPDSSWLYIFHLLEPSGSLIHITPIHNSSSQLIQNIPQAIVNTLLRPFPTDPPAKIEKWYFIIENWLLFGFLFYAIFKRKRNLRTEQKLLIVLLSVFSLYLTVMIGWVTPVLGAIIRYKLPLIFAIISIGWLLLYGFTKKEQCQKQSL
jgi:hypothetical protein